MSLLQPRKYSDLGVSTFLLDVKKGNKQALGEFIWQNQERFYSIAFIATNDAEAASKLTIEAFKLAYTALKQMNIKQLAAESLSDWLSQFIVNVIVDYHGRTSTPSAMQPQTDPTIDGSAQMDWETTVILGTQRVKRCINSLAEEQKKVFILRHQLGLNMKQVTAVLHQNPENVMAWLHRSRVQVVKCLGRG
jgi:RNA polymerase sigma factor (sigma-70 family)